MSSRPRSGMALRTPLRVLVLAVVTLAACRTVPPPAPKGPEGVPLEGLASWYGPEFAGRPTANGEIFDPQSMTAAHRTLPFGTIVDVTNLKNGRTTRVRINDRGPFVGNRIIDLSYAAAASLQMVEDGVSMVRLDIIRLGKGEREAPEPYRVTIDLRPSEEIPIVRSTPATQSPTQPAAPPPSPEPVRTLDESGPVEVTEIAEPPAPSSARPTPTTTTTATTAPPPAAPAAQPASRATTGSAWKVQVGAFGVEDNAQRLARELRSVVSPVYVETIGGLHRVRVGPFESKVQAIEASERLHAAGYEAIVLSPDAR
jgi:rare lipoprotein A